MKYYATRLNGVEINHTFRQLPKAATLENWVNATPGRLCVRLQGAHADHAPLPVGPGPSTRPPRPPGRGSEADALAQVAQNLPKSSSLDLHGEPGNWPGARFINSLRMEVGFHARDCES